MWVFVSDSTVLDKFLDFASEVQKHQGLRPKSKILQPKNEILWNYCEVSPKLKFGHFFSFFILEMDLGIN